MDDSKQATKFAPLDPDFPFLALRAAIELEHLINRRDTEISAVGELASALRDAPAIRGSAANQMQGRDPVGIDVLARAFEKSDVGAVTSVAELVKRAKEVAASLQRPATTGDAARLHSLRDFCIALSQVATSYQHEQYEQDRPRHSERE